MKNMLNTLNIISIKPLLLGLLFSNFGTNLIQFALSLYVLDQTGSAKLFANVLIVSLLAKIIFTPFGGNLIDNHSKKGLVIILDVGYFLSTLALFFVESQNFNFELIIVYSVVVGTLSALEIPVVQAITPLLVSKSNLISINGLISQISVATSIMGPLVAGIFYNNGNFTSFILVSSMFFVVATVFEIFLEIPKVSQRNQGVWQGTKITINFLLHKGKKVRQLAILAGIINMMIAALIEVGGPLIFRIQYHWNNFEYGNLQAGLALSTLIGAMLAGVIIRKVKQIHLIIIYSVLPLLISGILLQTIYKELALILLVISFLGLQFGFAIISIVVLSRIQRIVPENILGGVMAMVMLLSLVMLPIGEGVYGNLFTFINTQQLLGLLLIINSGLTIVLARINRKVLS